ncbi:MAG: M20/M25/M40 family metallo-hydrolase [Planctomycetota bacterium]|nr:M20/M25/M40 family metallo-hydrolase [Planctomycetota bacterium]
MSNAQPDQVDTPRSENSDADQSLDVALDVALNSITVANLKRHIDFLASDTLQGREAGTEGNYAAGAYIVDRLRKLKLTAASTDGSFYQYFHPNFRNIVVVIPGSDEQLKSEYILVGGHYDHVGFGNQTNSRGPFGIVHNGADDNASGTAGILEIAEALASLRVKPKRSILIAFWDGEEKGLLGSRHYADYPIIPLKQIRFHLNADMIGRLRPAGLEISGWRAATGSRHFLAQRNTDSLPLRFMYSYKPESDHWPFFERRVPSLMIHTGKHDDYHRPSDDVDLLNMDGIRKVSQFMLRSTVAVANEVTPPEFRDWSNEESDQFTRVFNASTQNRRSRLGVTYNGQMAEEGIIQLSSIVVDSPAHMAGLRIGDTVVSVNDQVLKKSLDFRTLVLTAPSKSMMKVRRGDAELDLSVSLLGDPILFGFHWTMDDAEPGSIIVTHVTAGSPADKAGLKQQHRIRNVAGNRFSSRNEFHKLLVGALNPIELGAEFDGKLSKISLERADADQASGRQ